MRDLKEDIRKTERQSTETLNDLHGSVVGATKRLESVKAELTTLTETVQTSHRRFRERVNAIVEVAERDKSLLQQPGGSSRPVSQKSKSPTRPLFSYPSNSNSIAQRPKPHMQQSLSLPGTKPILQKPKPRTQHSSPERSKSTNSKRQTPRGGGQSSSSKTASKIRTAASTPAAVDDHDIPSRKATIIDESEEEELFHRPDKRPKDSSKKTSRKRKSVYSDETEIPGVRSPPPLFTELVSNMYQVMERYEDTFTAGLGKLPKKKDKLRAKEDAEYPKGEGDLDDPNDEDFLGSGRDEDSDDSIDEEIPDSGLDSDS